MQLMVRLNMRNHVIYIQTFDKINTMLFVVLMINNDKCIATPTCECS